MLWEIVGTPHKLLGSMHILPEDVVLPDWVAASHSGIKRFVFERDHRSKLGEWIGVDRTMAHLQLFGVSEVYQRAKRLLESMGSDNRIECLCPWNATFYCVAHVNLTLGLSHPHGIESRFRKLADENNIAVEFLESPTRTLELIDSACKRTNADVDFFKKFIGDAESGVFQLKMRSLFQSWLASDLDAFATIHNDFFAESPVIFDAIVTQRNQNWNALAKRLILDEIPTLFIVGSLHTVGSDSFIEQLEANGFRFKFIA
jgi:uncharacterized protein